MGDKEDEHNKAMSDMRQMYESEIQLMSSKISKISKEMADEKASHEQNIGQKDAQIAEAIKRADEQHKECMSHKCTISNMEAQIYKEVDRRTAELSEMLRIQSKKRADQAPTIEMLNRSHYGTDTQMKNDRKQYEVAYQAGRMNVSFKEMRQ